MGLEQMAVVTLVYYVLKKTIIEKPNNPYKKKLIYLAFLLYSGILIKLYFDSKPLNTYELLNVPRCTSSEDLKENYKNAIKTKHPDKNPHPNAQTEFIEIKKRFDLIRTPDSREKYEKFGDIAESLSFWNSFSFYVAWIFVCNSIYFSKIPNAGRNLLCCLSIFGVLESYFFVKFSFYFNFCLLPLPIFEQLQIIRTVFPAVLLGICCLEAFENCENERKIKTKYEKFLQSGGNQLIKKITKKESPLFIKEFVAKAKANAAKKYSDNGGHIISLLFLLLLIYGKATS